MIKDTKEYIQSCAVGFRKSLRKFFKYKNKDRKYTTKKILVGGGYGYGNVGDEAQCSATLKLLSERYPDYQIVNLTPNVEYSKKQHPLYNHDFASRVLLFNQGRESNGYDFKRTLLVRIVFLLKSFHILFNALLVRADLPTFFINARVAKFLYELKEASLFYFCGGGYLTGSTLSRFWDGILICRLAHLFKTPVVMSGQTIGIWENNFNKAYARWGFKHVQLISVRDEEFSLKDLKEINLFGERYFATHDDALHCEKTQKQLIDKKDYVTLNFHYWGMKGREKRIYLAKINKIVNLILEKTEADIVFIPMFSADKDSFDEYIKKYPNTRVQCFEYNYDFREIRRVIADSKMCITMKHHPIIFAMGELVPVISLAFSKYYMHKNLGALAQYGQEEYCIDLESENYLQDFIILFDKIINNSQEIKEIIEKNIKILDERKDKFLKMVDEIIVG
ncbi:MAG: polysaccharide pyruvyl transferase family protein [Candidatus Gastranaerophilales bacterium]|nr:polysaccharide pyruvyl transferase family protein [Candidatus Gastranaerophilales bacterium]